jgi:hypothetical protein
VEQAALDRVQQLIEDDVKARFPGGGIERVAVLQYGDEPAVEPGELAVRVFVAAEGDPEDRERVVEDFGRAFRRELDQLRRDLSEKLPAARRVDFCFGDDLVGPGIKMKWDGRTLEARALAGGELTPVMARLGPTDLQTLDTLITAGIASNRADAVRWALARIRERPAYEQLRTITRSIEELKDQF